MPASDVGSVACPITDATACLVTSRRSRYSVRRLVYRIPASTAASPGASHCCPGGSASSPSASHRCPPGLAGGCDMGASRDSTFRRMYCGNVNARATGRAADGAVFDSIRTFESAWPKTLDAPAPPERRRRRVDEYLQNGAPRVLVTDTSG